MKSYKEYYQDQLDKVKNGTEIKVKFFASDPDLPASMQETKETNWMSLNHDSIEALIEFLNQLTETKKK